jgi:hypothetical protein
MKIDGIMSDWKMVETEYRDNRGDVAHRDYNGYGGLHYTNTSGRNDIVTCKVSMDKATVYFFAEADKALTTHTGANWMLLLIDSDQDPNTGWYGYDYLVNGKILDDKTTTLMAYNPVNTENPWIEKARLNYRYNDKAIELAIPLHLLGLAGNAYTFDFKWADNPTGLKDPISLCTDGDAAPNRRFNYRCIWSE